MKPSPNQTMQQTDKAIAEKLSRIRENLSRVES